MRLITPLWNGFRYEESVTVEPTPEQVTDAVLALDGKQRNDLYLTPADTDADWGQDDIPWLGVCGGPRLFMVGFNVTALDQYHVAVDRRFGDEIVEIMCGGQNSDFPRYQLVTSAAALMAALTFAANSRRSERLSWERA